MCNNNTLRSATSERAYKKVSLFEISPWNRALLTMGVFWTFTATRTTFQQICTFEKKNRKLSSSATFSDKICKWKNPPIDFQAWKQSLNEYFIFLISFIFIFFTLPLNMLRILFLCGKKIKKKKIMWNALVNPFMNHLRLVEMNHQKMKEKWNINTSEKKRNKLRRRKNQDK